MLVCGPLSDTPQTKSAIDWEQYKTEAGLSEELEAHRKNGFVEKAEFIDEARWREHEAELARRGK